MMSLGPISLSEFAARVAIHSGGPGGVLALVSDAPGLADDLRDELSVFSEQPVRCVAVGADAEETLTRLDAADGALVVLTGLDTLGPTDWAELDQLRNRIAHAGTIVMCLRLADLQMLQDHAPNLSSWLGGRVWRLDESSAALSEREVEERLASLRRWAGRSDAEVVALAHQGQLPAEPEYAEWLVLLGQGGLIR